MFTRSWSQGIRRRWKNTFTKRQTGFGYDDGRQSGPDPADGAISAEILQFARTQVLHQLSGPRAQTIFKMRAGVVASVLPNDVL